VGVWLLAAAGCSDFTKVQKSTDYEYKYKKALEYYEAKQYSHAADLLGSMIALYRGTSRADDIYYFYARSQFEEQFYKEAGQYFLMLVREFPMSDYSEESQFMVGYCAYKESPNARLDQSATNHAIDALVLYVNLYPDGVKVEEANKLVAEMRDKLVYKSFLNGKLYYDMGNYRAATIALANSLKAYPDTKYREQLSFWLLDAKYNLAVYSTPDKKELRMNDALDETYSFLDEFTESKHRRDAEKFQQNIIKFLNYEK
jgi:outer membrane protein assembly factor BamD